MADLSDVITALGQLVGNALYPTPPAIGNSVCGMPVLIQAGWPDPTSLTAQIAAKKAQVTIYPNPNEQNTTRFPQVWKQIGALQPATFALTGAGYTVTVAGAQPNPFYGQNFAVFVNGRAYVYRSLVSDSAATIATALAALIAADLPGTSAANGIITVPAPARIGALRIGTQATTVQDLKQQEREFSIIIWAASPAARDAIAKVIDPIIPQTKFLTFADATKGRLIYRRSPFSDFDQKQGIYRRDIVVTVEYSTIASSTGAQVVAVKGIYDLISPTGAEIEPPIATTYT